MNPLTDINIRLSFYQSQGYALFLAVLPLILMYRTPGLQVGLSTSMIAVGMVFAGCVIYRNIKRMSIYVLLALLLYQGYTIYFGTAEARMLGIAILVHLLAISVGGIDGRYLREVVEKVAMVAAGCVFVQQLLHYTLHINLQLLYSDWMISSLQYVGFSELFGESADDGLYRPSAFFMEPSHLAQYSIIALGSALFREEPRFRVALVVTLGMLMSTSGMGIVLVFGMWGWWCWGKLEHRSVASRLMLGAGVLLGALVLFLVLYQIPFFEKVFSRFIGTPEGEYNAIHGRTFGWNLLFAGKSIGELLWGFGAESLPEYYLTGFMTLLYIYGWVGVGLLLFMLVLFAAMTDGLPRTLLMVYISLLFIANLTGFIPMIFQLGCILSIAYQESMDEEEEELTNQLTEYA